MLLVGNAGVNRVGAQCLDFKDISSLKKMIYQKPGGFEATQRGYFFQRARQKEINLAQKVINGQRFTPDRYSLWFFKPPGDCPSEWYSQPNAGRLNLIVSFSQISKIVLLFIKGFTEFLKA